MRDTYVTVAGVVATEPRVVQLDDSRQITSFRMASTSRRKRDDGSWVDGPTSWYTVTCWRDLAENVEASVRKRDRVVVNGRQRIRDWQPSQGGGPRTTVEIDAESLGHDLAFGVSKFDRKVRGQVVQREHQREADEASRLAAQDAVDDARGSLVPDAVHFLQQRERWDEQEAAMEDAEFEGTAPDDEEGAAARELMAAPA